MDDCTRMTSRRDSFAVPNIGRKKWVRSWSQESDDSGCFTRLENETESQIGYELAKKKKKMPERPKPIVALAGGENPQSIKLQISEQKHEFVLCPPVKSHFHKDGRPYLSTKAWLNYRRFAGDTAYLFNTSFAKYDNLKFNLRTSTLTGSMKVRPTANREFEYFYDLKLYAGKEGKRLYSVERARVGVMLEVPPLKTESDWIWYKLVVTKEKKEEHSSASHE